MKQKMKERIARTTYPNQMPDQDEWCKQFGVGSGYTKPTNFYNGNEFNTEIFKRKQTTSSPGGILSGIINFLTTFTWAV